MKLNKISEYYSYGWCWFLTAYILALILSWGVIHLIEEPDQIHTYQRVVEVETEEENFQVSFYRLSPDQQVFQTPVVLLHDNVYSAKTLIPLASELKNSGFEVIIPEYPGYGYTDYPGGFSLEDKKTAVSKILEINHVDEYHAIGFGLGGAVAFYLSDQPGDEPKSLVLLSAIGLQELHLMGTYTLNKILYLIQFPVYHLIYNLTPHFGWLDKLPVSYSSLKSNYESDLRPVSDLINQYENPVLILHGENDRHVNIMTAEEHYRLIPQSELEIFDGNHLIALKKAPEIAKKIGVFLHHVNNGSASNRADAASTRVEKSQEPLAPGQVTTLAGISLILFMLLLMASTFVNEDLACIAAGLIVAKGVIGYIPAVAACYTGILLTDTTVYWIGRWIGSPVLRRIPFRWFIDEKDVRKTEDIFKESGLPIIFVSRFIPGTRLPTYFSAGMVRAKFSLIIFYFMLAILIWAPFLVGLSYFIGQQMLDYFHLYQGHAFWIFALLLLIIFMGIKLLIPMATRRGRKKLKVKFEKIRRRLKLTG